MPLIEYDKPKVAFLCPNSGLIESEAVKYMMAAIASAWKHGIQVEQIGLAERMVIHTARNCLATMFMQTDCEWAFWVDSDMIIPPNTIQRLMNTAKEKNALFATGVYYQRQGEHMAVLWKKDPVDEKGVPYPYSNKKDDMNAYRHHAIVPNPDSKRAFKADVCGFGCVLTHRSMFTTIKKPWFKTIADQCSEDFYFCTQARMAGIQLWADPSLRIGHIGTPQIIFAEHMKIDKANLKPIKVEA